MDNLKRQLRNASAKTTWEQAFAEVDEDGSGELDFDEFTAAVALFKGPSAAKKISSAELQNIFQTIDSDENGTISCQEVQDFVALERTPCMTAEGMHCNSTCICGAHRYAPLQDWPPWKQHTQTPSCLGASESA